MEKIEIKKIKKNLYGGSYGKFKFQIKYSPLKLSDSIVFEDKTTSGWLQIEEIEKSIYLEYLKFRKNEH